MSITGADLYDSKLAQFAGQGSTSRFPKDYIRAVNFAVDEYCETLEETAPDHIDDIEDDIELPSSVEWVISLGIDRWILSFGNFKSGDISVGEAMALWKDALVTALHRRDKADIDAAVDTTDTVMAGEVIGTIGE